MIRFMSTPSGEAGASVNPVSVTSKLDSMAKKKKKKKNLIPLDQISTLQSGPISSPLPSKQQNVTLLRQPTRSHLCCLPFVTMAKFCAHSKSCFTLVELNIQSIYACQSSMARCLSQELHRSFQDVSITNTA